ncbi:MAG: pyrroline-5-carboxylate reductase [Phycisphaerae bacterium]|nr:pyrroline-5-carboxylate reductase [Phycisphaerae bacterium]MDD5380702.1 pyrroline-5-carboxylate reductase [Phycisphaerae bacterium]
MGRIGFIGSGNMAEALIKGIITARLYKPGNIFISDIRPGRLKQLAKKYKVKQTRGNRDLVSKADIIVLSVKPQNMTDALESIKGAVSGKKLVISIAAGVKVSRIAGVLGNVAIVRAMPNTPALIGEGASALFANDKAKPMLKKAKAVFSAVGKVVVVSNESLIDAVTAVSGSGPAYYFLLMEEMIKAGGKLGLSDDIVRDLVLQTAKGAALLAIDADGRCESPAKLRQKVTSPGGTTEAALKELAKGKFGALINSAIKKARDRSRQLSR